MSEPETFHFMALEFDVARFREMYKAKPERFRKLQYPAKDLAGQNAFIAIDRQYAATLTPEQLAEPLLAVTWHRALLLIDGHHRLVRLIDSGSMVEVILMPPRMTGKICTNRMKGRR